TVLQGSGSGGPFQLFWTAWRWTGDDKYLAPIRWRIDRNGWRSLNDINENAWPHLSLDEAGKAVILKAAERGGGFERYVAWSLTGDKKYLEALYADELQWGDQHMYMHTEGHWWSDRVEIPSDLLQRSRLGGIANKRGQMLASHRVSWTFSGASGEDVGLLIKDGSTTGFKVIAYNLTDKPVTATMTGWDVGSGRWSLTQGVDADGDDAIDGARQNRAVAFGRTEQVSVVLPPRQTAILDMALTTPGDAPERRADLGVGRGDVTVKGRTVTAVVHSLGAADTAPASVELVDAAGKVLASAAVPALEAPADLEPRTHAARLSLPTGIKTSGLKVRLVTDQPQITRLNDETTVP
ncbi:MAG: LamG domain-containing protein, partial [Caulobacter sp.]